VKKFFLIVALLALTVAVAAPAAAKKEVNLVYVEWSSEVASTNLVKAVIQEELGWECEITPVSAAAMWQAVATDEDVDGLVAAWLPSTHAHYLKGVADKVEDLGPNLSGTRIGLIVPTYVTIDSIDEMNAMADKFDGKIIGIDPGAGLMSKTEKVLKDYKLKDIELMEGSGATMTAELANRYKNKEWVCVTGWTPHWKFARFDLKYLKDPKNIYGGEEFIHTIVRKDLKKDKPEIYNFLDKFNWSSDQMAAMMVEIQGGMKPYDAAKKFIKENPDQVASWLK
jgi:glycine betaine/proline transport system substrate-binding protein